jgi:serpin B
MIKNLLKYDMITSDTVCILLNCLYFKAPWATKFKSYNTEKKPFFGMVDNKKVQIKTVDLMCLEDKKFKYFENNKFQIIEMDYEQNKHNKHNKKYSDDSDNDSDDDSDDDSVDYYNDKFTFGAILPKSYECTVPTLSEKNDLMENLSPVLIKELSIPKFRDAIQFDIKALLKIYKIQCMKSDSPIEIDNMFDKLDNSYPFNIDKIIHKAVIIVDEDGTEASAVTAMTMMKCCMMRPKESPIKFIADHSFSYYIRHIPTNTIIFSGLYK